MIDRARPVMALVGRGLCVQWGWALHCMAEWWGRACAVRGSTAICMGWRRRDGAFLRGALPLGRYRCEATARCMRGLGRAAAACVGAVVLCGAAWVESYARVYGVAVLRRRGDWAYENRTPLVRRAVFICLYVMVLRWCGGGISGGGAGLVSPVPRCRPCARPRPLWR